MLMNQRLLKLTLDEPEHTEKKKLNRSNSEELILETADYCLESDEKLDDSVELTILEHSASEEKKKFLERERKICTYLKSHGL
jgi:hypothetical protein